MERVHPEPGGKGIGTPGRVPNNDSPNREPDPDPPDQFGPLEQVPRRLDSMKPIRFKLDFEVAPQPTDTTCGPTCLQAVYRYFGHEFPLEQLIQEIPRLATGGTLAVHLGNHALRRGYRATLYTYNLRIFDPSWFNPQVKDFRARVAAQITLRRETKRRHAARAYLQFIDRGGIVRHEILNGSLIRGLLRRHLPILTGLSSTFLYDASRETPETNTPDDLRGEPSGHFVVICGYDREDKQVTVADPWPKNPYSGDHLYHVDMDRLLNAILLGVLTYDGNLLVIQPPD